MDGDEHVEQHHRVDGHHHHDHNSYLLYAVDNSALPCAVYFCILFGVVYFCIWFGGFEWVTHGL